MATKKFETPSAQELAEDKKIVKDIYIKLSHYQYRANESFEKVNKDLGLDYTAYNKRKQHALYMVGEYQQQIDDICTQYDRTFETMMIDGVETEVYQQIDVAEYADNRMNKNNLNYVELFV